MASEPRHITLIEPAERLSLRVGSSTLYYRRLSLGALAAIERQQATLLPAGPDQAPRWSLPPAALEAAVLAAVLLGWEGVTDATGREAPFAPAALARLPGRARSLVLRQARKLHPPRPPQPGESPS